MPFRFMTLQKSIVVALTFMLFFSIASVTRSQWTVLHPSILSPVHGAVAFTFVNKDSGFILCNKGLGVTSDAGTTWNLDSAIPDTGDHISFTSFDDGWLWSSEGNPYFHRTNDHGVKWELDSNTILFGLPTDADQVFYFQDSLKGWAGAGSLSISSTSDGGLTWQQQYNDSRFTGIAVEKIAFCNDRLGIALAGTNEMYVLRTTNGGVTWHNLSSNVVPSFLPETPTGLAYTDPRHAWFSTDGGGLFLSSDSGLNWKGIFVPGSGYGIQSISFADSNHGVVVRRNQDTGNGVIDVVDYTSDGGQTWDTTVFNDAIWYASFPNTSTAFVCSFFNLYRLSTANLAVSSGPAISSVTRIENEGGNLFVVLPQDAGGKLRVADALGRMLEERTLSPGARCQLSTSSPPQFRFVEVKCNGRVQVFKVLQ